MQNFDFYTPTYVRFGRGVEADAGAMARRFGGSRVLMVSGGNSARRSGLLDRVGQSLAEAGIYYVDFGGAQPNPLVSHVEEGVKLALAEKVDFILAVGGGSVADTAKAIAHGTANPDFSIWDMWSGKAPVAKTLPVGVVLTIPAAGSEMSDSAVLTNEALGIKKGINTDLNRPVFALMNPELAMTLPWYQMACGITDIMMHTLDRYFNPIWDNELTDVIAEGLLRTVISNGRKLQENPDDFHAMSEIMWCGSVSHNGLTGLGGQKDFSTHQFGHALSAVYNVTHGASLSATWASWARYVLDSGVERFAQYARNVWGISEADDRTAALAGIEATERYFESLGMPIRLRQLTANGKPVPAIDEKALEALAELCSFGGTRTIGSFQKLDQKDMLEIYRMAK